MSMPNWEELELEQCEDKEERDRLVRDEVLSFLQEIQRYWGENAYSEEEKCVDKLRAACEKIREATEGYWFLDFKESEKPYVEAWLVSLQYLLELEVRLKKDLISQANRHIDELNKALEMVRQYCR